MISGRWLVSFGHVKVCGYFVMSDCTLIIDNEIDKKYNNIFLDFNVCAIYLFWPIIFFGIFKMCIYLLAYFFVNVCWIFSCSTKHLLLLFWPYLLPVTIQHKKQGQKILQYGREEAIFCGSHIQDIIHKTAADGLRYSTVPKACLFHIENSDNIPYNISLYYFMWCITTGKCM